MPFKLYYNRVFFLFFRSINHTNHKKYHVLTYSLLVSSISGILIIVASLPISAYAARPSIVTPISALVGTGSYLSPPINTVVSSNTITFVFRVSDDTGITRIECRLQTQTSFSTCAPTPTLSTNPSPRDITVRVTRTNLPMGTNTITFRTVDTEGLYSEPVSFGFSIIAAPQASNNPSDPNGEIGPVYDADSRILANGVGSTNSRSAYASLVATASQIVDRVECSLNRNPWTVCVRLDPTSSFRALGVNAWVYGVPVGAAEIRTRVVDRTNHYGNIDTWRWTVLQRPAGPSTVTIVGDAGTFLSDISPGIVVFGNGETIYSNGPINMRTHVIDDTGIQRLECRLEGPDPVAPQPCSGTVIPAAGIPEVIGSEQYEQGREGTYTFRIRAFDSDNRVGEATFRWTLRAPDTTITANHILRHVPLVLSLLQNDGRTSSRDIFFEFKSTAYGLHQADPPIVRFECAWDTPIISAQTRWSRCGSIFPDPLVIESFPGGIANWAYQSVKGVSPCRHDVWVRSYYSTTLKDPIPAHYTWYVGTCNSVPTTTIGSPGGGSFYPSVEMIEKLSQLPVTNKTGNVTGHDNNLTNTGIQEVQNFTSKQVQKDNDKQELKEIGNSTALAREEDVGHKTGTLAFREKIR